MKISIYYVLAILVTTLAILRSRLQPTPTSLIIKIDGENSQSIRPERGILNFDIVASGPSQSTVSETLTTTTAELRQLLEYHRPLDPSNKAATPDAAIENFHIGALSTYSRPRHWDHAPHMRDGYGAEEDSHELVHHASVSFQATFRHLETMSEVAGYLSAVPNVEIRQVQWRLTPETDARVRSEVRKAALRDALAKAGDFAEVVGREVVVARVEDGRFSEYDGRVFLASVEDTYPNVNSGRAGDSVKLEPVDVVVRSRLAVEFVGK